MCYVDPNFDTYSLDMCAQYGILPNDPCLYLKGTPSPYLKNFHPQYAYNTPCDTYYSKPAKKTNWLGIAAAVLTTVTGGFLIFKGYKAVKSIKFDFIKNIFSNKTANTIKDGCKKAYNSTKNFFIGIWDKISNLCKKK